MRTTMPSSWTCYSFFCTWHTYVKLGLHMSSMLNSLTETTRVLRQVLCHFVKIVCSQYMTKELPSEEAARARRRKPATGAKNGKNSSSTARKVSYNMSTYKLHALGDYVANIWCYRTTDNYSTQIVGVFS